jgi:hypothetical protein
MLDYNQNLIEIGDTVAFPGPYGSMLCVGTVVRIWERTQYGSKYDCVRVMLQKPLYGKMERDCWGTITRYANGEVPENIGDNDNIVIVSKAIDNSTN